VEVFLEEGNVSSWYFLRKIVRSLLNALLRNSMK